MLKHFYLVQFAVTCNWELTLGLEIPAMANSIQLSKVAGHEEGLAEAAEQCAACFEAAAKKACEVCKKAKCREAAEAAFYCAGGECGAQDCEEKPEKYLANRLGELLPLYNAAANQAYEAVKQAYLDVQQPARDRDNVARRYYDYANAQKELLAHSAEALRRDEHLNDLGALLLNHLNEALAEALKVEWYEGYAEATAAKYAVVKAYVKEAIKAYYYADAKLDVDKYEVAYKKEELKAKAAVAAAKAAAKAAAAALKV